MKLLKTLAAAAAAAVLCLAAGAARIENAALGIAYEVPDGAEELSPGFYTDEVYLYTVSALPDMTYDDLVFEAEQTENIAFEEAAFGDFTGIYSLEEESGFAVSSLFFFEHDGVLIGAAVMGDTADEETAHAFFNTLSVLDESAGTPSSVEISFKVGESTLLINGKEVTVETPYTVGDGVTLVPLRVITEAFGAKVGWDEETETVTVDYPGVTVALTIGSTAAEVNGRFTTLPAAPELSEAGYTMVPLRFLAETFGADVSYDEATEAILVTLGEADEGGIFSLDRGVKEKYIGSTKYGWAFETLNGLTFYDDSFAMREEEGIALTDNSGTLYVVGCDKRDDNFDFKEEYDELVDSLKETARFMKLEKNTTDYDYDYFDVQMLEKNTYGEMLTVTRLYAFADHVFLVPAQINLKSEGAKDSALAVLDSLTFDVDPDNTYDIGSPVSEMKEYSFDELGISFSAPEAYDPSVSGENYSDLRSNRVYGRANGNGYIAVTFYSASDIDDLGKLLENQRAAELYGADKTRFDSTAVTKTEFCSFPAYTYELKCLTVGGTTLVGRQYAVTVGDYVYFIVVTATDIKTVDDILNTFEFTVLDASKEGFIFCTEDTREHLGTTFPAECGGYTLDVPGVFECDDEPYTSANSTYGCDSLDGVTVSEMVDFSFDVYGKGTLGIPLFDGMTAKEAAKTRFDHYYEEETDEIVSPLSAVTLGGTEWYRAVISYEMENGDRSFMALYCRTDGDKLLELCFNYDDLFDTPETKALGEQIVSSVKKTK